MQEVVASASGDIAIADAGAAKIYFVAGSTQRMCSAGTRGRGPGEFQDLTRIWFAGSVLYAYDGIASRITRFRTDCSLIDSRSTPTIGGSLAQVLAVAGGGQLLLGTVSYSDGQGSGLLSKQLNLATLASDGSMVPFGAAAAGYVYRVAHGNATTVYDVPFLGRSMVAALPEGFAWIGKESRTVDFRSARWAARRSTPLPLLERRFDRLDVRRHRDSLLAAIARAGEARFPGARSRIEYAFGENFPAVDLAPSVTQIISAGTLVFVRQAEESREGRSWLVVDSESGNVVGQFRLAKELRVVGASAQGVYAILLDEDDVEQLVEIRIRELPARR